MPSFRTHRVSRVLAERAGLQRVELDDGSRAYVLRQLIGDVAPGDEVVVNTTAVELGLGTGGWHVVHWNLARRDLDLPGRGHIMKLRYTSLQADAGAAEEEAAEPELEGPVALPDLHGVPVLVGSLHSQLGVVAAVLATAPRPPRVSYVMSDGAALPIALSDLVADLRERDLLHGTITAGHAFGGDLEAVGIASALRLAVERQRADVVVCTMGPGVVGTETMLGTTALEVAAIATTAVQLGARPVVVARASGSDPRPRHRGVSHHTRTALALTPVAVEVALPAGDALAGAIRPPHRAVEVEVPDVASVLDRFGLRTTTMGRGPADDPLSFRAAAAAAVVAAAAAAPAASPVARPGTVSGA